MDAEKYSPTLTHHKKTFYRRLVKGDQSLLRNNPGGWVIASDYPTNKTLPNGKIKVSKIFTSFPSPVEIFQYINELNPADRTHYETILDGAQKPHFDIDVELNQDHNNPNNHLSLLELSAQLKVAVTAAINSVLLDAGVAYNQDMHMLFFDSSTDVKVSFHIVIDGFKHDNNKEAKAFYELVKAQVAPNLREFMDHAVYGINQQFRLIGNHKLGKSNFKLVDYNLTKWTTTDGKIGEPLYNLRLLEASMVSFTSESKELPRFIVDKPRALRSTMDLSAYEKAVSDFYYASDCAGSGEIVNFTGQFANISNANIDNPGSFVCPLCNRCHEAENPKLSYHKGGLYWDCRRQGIGMRSKFIGYLDGVIAVNNNEAEDDDLLPNGAVANDGELFCGFDFATLVPLGTPVTTPIITTTPGIIEGVGNVSELSGNITPEAIGTDAHGCTERESLLYIESLRQLPVHPQTITSLTDTNPDILLCSTITRIIDGYAEINAVDVCEYLVHDVLAAYNDDRKGKGIAYILNGGRNTNFGTKLKSLGYSIFRKRVNGSQQQVVNLSPAPLPSTEGITTDPLLALAAVREAVAAKPIPKVVLTPQEKWDAYIIPKLIGDHIQDTGERLRSISTIVGARERYLLVMKAVCGTGKTVEIVRELEFNPDSRVLIVCGKRTLGRKQLKDLENMGFVYYEDRKGVLEDIPRLIVQIDSLWKVAGAYDYMILDEYTYTQDQLVTFTKMKKFCSDALFERIQRTPKVIVADAFISDNTIDLFRSLRPNNEIVIYENTYPKQSNKRIYIIRQEGHLLLHLQRSLHDGKKLIIPCGSKSDVDAFKSRLTKSFPNLRIKTYTSDNIIDVDPTSEWINADVVIFTSVLEAGNSFVAPHFDRCYGKFTPMSFSPESAVQMLFRARQLLDNDIYVYIDHRKPREFPSDIYNISQMKGYLKGKDCAQRRDLWGIINMSYIDKKIDTAHPFFHMFADVKLRRLLGTRDYENRVLSLLKSQGCQFGGIIDAEEDDKKEIKAISFAQKEAKDLNEQHMCEAIAESPVIDFKTAEAIANNERATIEDRYKLQKYNLMERYQLTRIGSIFVSEKLRRNNAHRMFTIFSELSGVEDDDERFAIVSRIKDKLVHGENKGDTIHITERMANTERMDEFRKCNDYVNMLRHLGINDFIAGGLIKRSDFLAYEDSMDKLCQYLNVADFNGIMKFGSKKLGIRMELLDKDRSPIIDVDNPPPEYLSDGDNYIVVTCCWKKAEDRDLYMPLYNWAKEDLRPITSDPPEVEDFMPIKEYPRVWDETSQSYIESTTPPVVIEYPVFAPSIKLPKTVSTYTPKRYPVMPGYKRRIVPTTNNKMIPMPIPNKIIPIPHTNMKINNIQSPKPIIFTPTKIGANVRVQARPILLPQRVAA